MVWIGRFHRGLCPVSLLFTVFLLVGTSSSAAEKKEDARGIPPEELRYTILRFATRSGAEISHVLDITGSRSETPKARPLAHKGKLRYVTAAFAIAVGPNPEVNLLDMVVFVTLSRIVVEEYWVPQVFGNEGKRLLDTFRKVESDIWTIAAKVLTPQEQQELRGVIQDWRKSHPDQTDVIGVRFGDFVEKLGKSSLARRGGGFLGIKGATRAADEIRLLAERGLFSLQWMPSLLRWQAELLLYEVAATPEIQQLLSNTTQFTETTKEFVTLAKDLPNELMSQEKRVRGLLGDLRQTLKIGTELASQVNATVGSVDGLVARVHARREEPIDLKDVQKLAVQASEVVEQLNTLVKSTEQLLTSPGWKDRLLPFDQTVDRLGAETGEWMTYAFRLGVALILIFLIGSVLAGLTYRLASERLVGSRQARGG